MPRCKVNPLLLSEQPPASVYTKASTQTYTHDIVIQLGHIVWTSTLNANIFSHGYGTISISLELT